MITPAREWCQVRQGGAGGVTILMWRPLEGGATSIFRSVSAGITFSSGTEQETDSITSSFGAATG
jgi:hypothetical protein